MRVVSYYPEREEQLMGEKQIKTDCYKCTRETTTYADAVHPLCDGCEQDFDDWFYKQVEELDRAGR